MEIILTDENFQTEVLKSNIPVLVDFWAPWCMPCKMLAPIIDEIADEFQGKIKVCKLNVEEASATSAEYGIMSIPTLIIFKDGKEKDKIVGTAHKIQIISRIKLYL